MADFFARERLFVKPVVQALVLAEHVYEDKSGKKIIAGTFNRLILSKEPPIQKIETPEGETRTRDRAGGIGAPYLYMSLTDVCDNTPCELHLVNLTRNKVIFRTGFVIQCNDRLASVEFFAPLPAPEHTFREPGVYAIEIVYEGEAIGSLRITVINAEDIGRS